MFIFLSTFLEDDNIENNIIVKDNSYNIKGILFVQKDKKTYFDNKDDGVHN